jgi:hypothetical protein
MDPRIREVGPIRTTPLFDMAVDLQPPQNFGDGPFGRRMHFSSAGGTFHGPDLHGAVLPGAGDWALFRPDGAMLLDVRLSLRTHDGALVYMTYGGRYVTPPDLKLQLADTLTRHRIDPARYYFRTNPIFETGSKQYAWLNDVVCVGIGYLIERGVAYRVFRVL